MISAAYAAAFQARSVAPVYVAAGQLSIEGVRVFGSDIPPDESAFAKSNLSWDGHCWLLFGDFIADASLFRTAYSPVAPPLLKCYVRERFGEGRGLLVDRQGRLRQEDSLSYDPQYVLTTAQIAGLLAGGRDLVTRRLDELSRGRNSNRKLGRNDPCSCGSGKKFKKCHGR